MRILAAIILISVASAAGNEGAEHLQGHLVGGWGPCDTSICETAWKEHFNHNYFKHHHVTGCTCQVVAGQNLGIKLSNEGDRIPECVLRVYKDLKQKFTIYTDRQEEDDCVKKFKAAFD